MSHIRLERTIWPVGHGAFYTEQFRGEHGSTFTVAYDCGAKSQSLVIDYIKKSTGDLKMPIDVLYISHLHTDHINGLYYLLHTQTTANTPLVKKVILPHLHPNAVLEAIVYNFINTASNRESAEANENTQTLLLNLLNGEYGAQVTQVGEDGDRSVVIQFEEGGVNNPKVIPERVADGANIILQSHGKSIWLYKPIYYLSLDDCEKLKKAVDALMGGKLLKGGDDIDWNELLAYLQSLPKKKNGNIDCSQLKDEYDNIFKGDQPHNAYSMPIYSGPTTDVALNHIYSSYRYNECLFARVVDVLYRKYFDILAQHSAHCLYTGDFEADIQKNLDKLKQILGALWAKIGLLQIPHHISDSNYNPDFYDHRMLTFGNVDNKGDESFTFSIYRIISYYHHCPAVAVTEKDEPLEFGYDIVLI